MRRDTLLARIGYAIEDHHQSTMRLQELAGELVDHCERMRSFTDRLHVLQDEIAEAPQEEAVETVEPFHMPRVLQGGPNRGTG